MTDLYTKTISPKTKSIPKIVLIDSIGRDNVLTTSSNEYTVTLPSNIPDVTYIELIQCDVPNSNYNIDATVDTINIQVDTLTPFPTDNSVPAVGGTDVRIEHGFYTIDELLTAIDDALTGVFGGVFTLTKNSINNKISITCDKQFALYFNGGISGTGNRVYRNRSIGQLLGFKPANYTDPATIISDYPYNMDLDRFIVLNIHDVTRCDSNNQNIQGGFCIIPLDSGHNNFKFVQNTNISSENYIHYFSSPRTISKLRLSFRDWSGQLYDFKGKEHVLSFRMG